MEIKMDRLDYKINQETPLTSTQLMLNAFGALTQKVFGNVSTRRFFTL
jgi:hypothetical protein